MSERTSKAQVQAYRFGVRRLEQALVTGSAKASPTGSGRPGVRLLIGLVIAGLLTAGFAVYGFIKPAPSIRDAKVVVDTDNGGAYVIRDGVAYPALNLASALLATVDAQGGSAEGAARQVNGQTLAKLPKGQTLGIVNAPNIVPTKQTLVPDAWSVCDETGSDPDAAPELNATPRTTVLVGIPAPTARTDIAVLVTADGRTTHLIWNGHRSLLAPDSAQQVAAALGLDLAEARRVSPRLLSSIPESAPLVIPQVPAAGSAVRLGNTDYTVGEVLRTVRADGTASWYAVHRDGLQQIPPVVADLLRAAGPKAAAREVGPADIAAAGRASAPIDLTGYPQTRPVAGALARTPVLCSDWRNTPGGTPVTGVRLLPALPLPSGAKPVPAPPANAKDTAARASAVYLAPQHGLVAGQSVNGKTAGEDGIYLVTDQGLRYPVAGTQALTALGLAGQVVPVPGEILALLPLGPTLDPAVAREYAGAAGGLGS